jgi:hypothetical protein
MCQCVKSLTKYVSRGKNTATAFGSAPLFDVNVLIWIMRIDVFCVFEETRFINDIVITWVHANIRDVYKGHVVHVIMGSSMTWIDTTSASFN